MESPKGLSGKISNGGPFGFSDLSLCNPCGLSTVYTQVAAWFAPRPGQRMIIRVVERVVTLGRRLQCWSYSIIVAGNLVTCSSERTSISCTCPLASRTLPTRYMIKTKSLYMSGALLIGVSKSRTQELTFLEDNAGIQK